ncbi:hypothetical protein [Reichenbachiella sp.]|uniref:hypothetical protein n=1 Tax=Reichenbachiella sp. TaxID=2184521 RepID=UPI003BB22076
MTIDQSTKYFLFCSVLLFVSISPSSAQSCDNSDSFFDLLFDILSNDNNDNFANSEEYKPQMENPTTPIIRSDKTEWKYGISIMGAPRNIGYRPGGLEVGFYSQAFSSNRFYLGLSTAFYPLKRYAYDSLFNDFDKIRTNQNIFSFHFAMKYNIIKNKKFQLALGAHAGTMIFGARTFAQDNTCDCEGERTPNQTLKDYTAARPDYGVSINLQFALKNPYNKLFIEVMRQSPGNSTYLEKDGVEVKPNNIHYPLVENNWNMLVFKVGFSQYF